MARPSGKAGDPVAIRKHASRRLCDTERSSCVTLGDLAAMVRKGADFVVVDAKSGDGIARGALAQIILEQEAKGAGPLPEGFLRGLIGLYDDGMRKPAPGRLELSFDESVRNQDGFRRRLGDSIQTLFPVPGFREMARRNMEAVRAMMRPFADGAARRTAPRRRGSPSSGRSSTACGSASTPSTEGGSADARRPRAGAALFGGAAAPAPALEDSRARPGPACPRRPPPRFRRRPGSPPRASRTAAGSRPPR